MCKDLVGYTMYAIRITSIHLTTSGIGKNPAASHYFCIKYGKGKMMNSLKVITWISPNPPSKVNIITINQDENQ